MEQRKTIEAEAPTIRVGATLNGLIAPPPLQPPKIFYRPDALPAAKPTASKHWRQSDIVEMINLISRQNLKLKVKFWHVVGSLSYLMPNPKWRTSTVLKSACNVITQWLDEIYYNMQNDILMTNKRSKSKPEEQIQYGGRLFPKTRKSFNSVINWQISTKFGMPSAYTNESFHQTRNRKLICRHLEICTMSQLDCGG